MTAQPLEERLLELAERQRRNRASIDAPEPLAICEPCGELEVLCDCFDYALDDATVSHLLAIVVAARADLRDCHTCYCDAAWTERGLHATECKFDEVDDLRTAFADFDTPDLATKARTLDVSALRRDGIEFGPR